MRVPNLFLHKNKTKSLLLSRTDNLKNCKRENCERLTMYSIRELESGTDTFFVFASLNNWEVSIQQVS